MLKIAGAFIAGCILATVAKIGIDEFHYVERMPRASLAPASLPMREMAAGSATILSGQPNFKAAQFSTSHDKRHSSGVWSAEGPSRFRWRYDADEAVYIEEGEVQISYQGRSFVAKHGDSVFFQSGTTAEWTVPKYVQKSWTIHGTNRLTRWLRPWVDSRSTVGSEVSLGDPT